MHAICDLADLEEGRSLRAILPDEPDGNGVCVVRRNNRIHAYLNRCPHTGAPMDWIEGQFLSRDGQHIQCSLHGARFRISDGYCIAGPCRGSRLTAVATGTPPHQPHLE